VTELVRCYMNLRARSKTQPPKREGERKPVQQMVWEPTGITKCG